MSDSVQEQIKELLDAHEIVLFMKGEPEAPACGFSARVVTILNASDIEFDHVNVLEDDAVREGIKVYGRWPTIPQLYYKGNLIGGCDIIMDLHESGELRKSLGFE